MHLSQNIILLWPKNSSIALLKQLNVFTHCQNYMKYSDIDVY